MIQGVSPYDQLKKWIDDFIGSETESSLPMVLSTLADNGYPDSRVVFFKGWKDHHLTFYTNYLSAKGNQIDKNLKVCLNFYSRVLQKQIRIQGNARKLNSKDSDQYFNSRSFESKISATVSKQSSVLDSYDGFIKNLEKKEQELKSKNVERPSYWGGYEVEPVSIEFWHQQPHRRHRREVWIKKDLLWETFLLYP